MKEKFFLYLTDRDVSLYKGADKVIGPLIGDFEASCRQIHTFLAGFPNTPLSLFVDRGHQDIQEEKLPSLFPWDRVRFLAHKKSQWTLEGGYVGFHFLKQGQECFFRWIHILQNDPLTLWISWLKALSNPLAGIFFVPLEAGKYLIQNFSPQKRFQVLLYPLPSEEGRHVIFKGDRLLLSRALQGEEDLKTSLHYLSRSFPDIHEHIECISFLPKSPQLLNYVTTSSDFQRWILFLTEQTKPSILLRQPSSLGIFWLRIGGMTILISALLFIIIKISQGISYKNESSLFLSQVNELKMDAVYNPNIDVVGLQKALEHYHYLKSLQSNPLETLEKLSFLIKNHKLHLDSVSWFYEKNPEILLDFLMEIQSARDLSFQLDLFISACKRAFPNSQIFVLKAPFNSGPQQVFTRYFPQSSPMAQVKIVLP